MINLNEIARQAAEISSRRFENGAFSNDDTSAILKHCATEVIEATEAYSRYTEKVDNGLNSSFALYNFSSELADIICCVLIIAGKEGIDIEKALLECIEKNRKRAEKQGDKL